MSLASMEKGTLMKLIEWNPIPFDRVSKEGFPASCARVLHIITIGLLLPMSVLGYLSSDWPIAWQLLPLYLSLFVFGMPHGGADHLLLWGMVKKSSLVFQASTLLAYPVLSLIYLAFWNYQPVPSALFFLAITIFHWGQGDRFLSVKLHGAGYLERSGPACWAHILARGSLPILLPGYLGNDTYREFLEAMVAQGGGTLVRLDWVTENQILFLLLPTGFVVLQFLFCLLNLRPGEGRALLTDFVEASVLFAWFLLLPPLWAIGSYFALWHSLRHGLRILWTDGQGRRHISEGRFLRVKARWLQLTWLMTALALVGLWFILSMPLTFRGIQLDWLGKAMLGISILTLPHTVVVCLMDRIQLAKKLA